MRIFLLFLGKYNWDIVKKLQKGDVVYSITEDKIISVNIVTSEPKKKKKPSDLDIPAAGDGWYVSLNYSQLKRSFTLRETHKNEITKLCAGKESPYNSNGSANEGHIFEITYEAHKYMMGLVSTYNLSNNLDLPELQERDVALIHQIDDMVMKYETKEHKALAVRMGLLETVLKQMLLSHNKKCAVCDIDYTEFLSAVYCKPWDDASTSEKLDINNLLLMCPLHREMFERGFITFNDKGMIKISGEMRFENFKSLSINLFTSINMTESQVDYIQWHRKNVFKE